MNSINHQTWLTEVIQMAVKNVESGGGPFAAIVVQNDRIIGSGVNEVHLASDPTAHAELLAIKEACIALGTTDLSDCIVYASGEPCPMCMGAIYWAKPKAVYYACSKSEAAAAVNFSDPLANFYQDAGRPGADREVPLHQLDHKQRLEPFKRWHQQQI